MRLMKLARVCRILSLCLNASHAQALPKLQIHPVELLGYAGDSVRLAVVLPCGTTFYGLVAAVDSATSTLRLAAAVAQESIVCSSMPDATEVRIDYLATTRFATIEPMSVDDGTRLMIARINDLRVATAGGTPSLTAVYAPRCGRDLGTLIHPAGADRLELAFVERVASGPPLSCASAQKTRQITALDLGTRFKVAALRDKQKSLGRAYRLRLAAVRPDSLRRLAGGGLALVYRRGCNDAPVGLVLGQPGGAAALGGTAAHQVQVGMLVAEYYNVPCSDAPGAAPWATAAERDLVLPDSWRVAPLPASQPGAALVLREPTRLRRAVASGVLNVDFLSTCGAAYAVYSHDWRGALAVGVLTADLGPAAGASRCKKAPGEVSLFQPFVARGVPAGELYPMQLKGQSAH